MWERYKTPQLFRSMTAFGDIDLGQHWLRLPDGTNVNLSTVRPDDIHLSGNFTRNTTTANH